MAKRNVVLHDKYKSTTALYPKIDAKSLTPEAVTEITRITEVVVEEQVVPNPTPTGEEPNLDYITINNITYKVPTASPQVQSNWNETDTESPAYIQNKPTIPVVTNIYLHTIKMEYRDQNASQQYKICFTILNNSDASINDYSKLQSALFNAYGTGSNREAPASGVLYDVTTDKTRPVYSICDMSTYIEIKAYGVGSGSPFTSSSTHNITSSEAFTIYDKVTQLS